mmetsp:Transcript_14193/g.40805  ORF Transcript_14193/g.40805 Transcript_14193/m.40805 type:complete len:216 (+) Transcript_14193:2871-3518(+)
MKLADNNSCRWPPSTRRRRTIVRGKCRWHAGCPSSKMTAESIGCCGQKKTRSKWHFVICGRKGRATCSASKNSKVCPLSSAACKRNSSAMAHTNSTNSIHEASPEQSTSTLSKSMRQAICCMNFFSMMVVRCGVSGAGNTSVTTLRNLLEFISPPCFWKACSKAESDLRLRLRKKLSNASRMHWRNRMYWPVAISLSGDKLKTGKLIDNLRAMLR